MSARIPRKDEIVRPPKISRHKARFEEEGEPPEKVCSASRRLIALRGESLGYKTSSVMLHAEWDVDAPTTPFRFVASLDARFHTGTMREIVSPPSSKPSRREFGDPIPFSVNPDLDGKKLGRPSIVEFESPADIRSPELVSDCLRAMSAIAIWGEHPRMIRRMLGGWIEGRGVDWRGLDWIRDFTALFGRKYRPTTRPFPFDGRYVKDDNWYGEPGWSICYICRMTRLGREKQAIAAFANMQERLGELPDAPAMLSKAHSDLTRAITAPVPRSAFPESISDQLPCSACIADPLTDSVDLRRLVLVSEDGTDLPVGHRDEEDPDGRRQDDQDDH